MLRDEDPDKQLFIVSVGFPGKRPVSDREAVVEELKVQGKWQEGDGTGGDGAEGEPGGEGEGDEDADPSPESESAPFIGSMWVLAAVIGAFFVFRKIK